MTSPLFPAHAGVILIIPFDLFNNRCFSPHTRG